jgi:ribosome biogenesis GTPase
LSVDDSKRTQRGRIYKKLLGRYHVRIGEKTIECTISSKLRKQLIYPTADPASLRPVVVDVQDIKTVDPLAIGDWVCFVDAGEGAGMITDVYPRKNRLRRKATGAKPLEQVIASNLDQMVAVVAAAQPMPKWRLVDRYLADAESLDLPAIICIAKVDLLPDRQPLGEELEVYENMGYSVVTTSVVTGEGIEGLKELLRDKASVLVGKSGVGKTSLLNSLQPDLGLRVREVSKATGKGKHATSHLEMFGLDIGGAVIDTPGMRQFGLWDVASTEVAYLFREMRPYIGGCKFSSNCRHVSEPGCAIREAVGRGEITERRYLSFLRLAGGQ